ncbi:MAG: carbohydrate binding family 9 domain-containing protein [Acidobacteria bacterium]|nr:carbohydrate binding family 9 domain-containing protein [Acidobacteriota bacterium]
MNKKIFIGVLIFFIWIPCLWTQIPGKRIGADKVLNLKLIATPPKIDGILDDPVWQTGPVVNEPFVINSPVYGEILPQKTDIYLTYDYNNLYVAFYCHDPEPEKIKTSINRRDNLGNDDWISFNLDATGNRQLTYEHLCNPYGIQCDKINEDPNPDWIWYSSGKLAPDGYIVEMKIPFKSLHFKSGNNVMLYIGFFRFVSRSATNASWPQLDEQIGYFNSLTPIVFEKLNPNFRLEALPAFTYESIWDRESPSKWSQDHSSQLGIGLKYGITSSINAEITINPDFSQVESDEFQVLANQRYPIFYSEKRPFFMEIQNQFNLAGISGSTNMSTAVHTRNIIDPAWGGKITGELGKISGGILAAGDEWPGRNWDGSTNGLLNKNKNANFLLGRLKCNLKGDNYAGLIYTSRKFGADSNQVVGGDLRFRLKGNHNISLNALLSHSQNPGTNQKSNGGAFTLAYENYRKPLNLYFFAEHYTQNFRMDSAYYYRTGITSLWANVCPHFYPSKEKIPWLVKSSWNLFSNYTYDHVSKMTDFSVNNQFIFYFPFHATFSLLSTVQKEAWKGQSFNQFDFRAAGKIQLTNWLYLYSAVSVGKLLYYTDSLLGRKTTFLFQTVLQPGNRFTQHLEYQYQRFTKLIGHEPIYDLNIIISKTSYQFNKYFFIKALIQYDSYQKKVLTDLLGSFTLIPGTVIYLGYGSLHNKNYWDAVNSKWTTGSEAGKYYQFIQSLFFKASYIIRF